MSLYYRKRATKFAKNSRDRMEDGSLLFFPQKKKKGASKFGTWEEQLYTVYMYTHTDQFRQYESHLKSKSTTMRTMSADKQILPT